MKWWLGITAVLLSNFLFAQELPLHVDQKEVYAFIDELALEKVIDLKDHIKPYGSNVIWSALKKAKGVQEQLTARQQVSLVRYLDYFDLIYANKDSLRAKSIHSGRTGVPYFIRWSPPGVYYKDRETFLSFFPIVAVQLQAQKDDYIFQRRGGASFQAKFGQHLSVYANLHDNAESQLISDKSFLFNGTGGNYKRTEYSEMRGGLNYRWKWGNISLNKDHLEWGSQYNGANIFSDRAPSFLQIKLELHPADWFSFDYFHGWLVSNVIDSTESYWTANGLRRDVMHGKYIAANMYSFELLKNLSFSVGNSVVYSADQPYAAYLVPFFFYKSIDHWLNSTDGAGTYVGQNSQMFFNMSSYNLKGVHLYASLFIDELKTTRIFDSETHNFWSYKIGAKSKAFFIDDLYLGFEYTRTSPITYQHNISTTTFESNGFNLGHYLRDNSDERYLYFEYKPLDKLRLKGEWVSTRKGEEYGYKLGSDAILHPFMEAVQWREDIFSLSFAYEIRFALDCSFKYSYRNARGEALDIYSPSFYQGINHVFSFGIQTGF
jgi:hypothetical protein